METVSKILTPTVIACLILALVFLLRHWILVRLKNAVKHEYDVQLKKFESDLTRQTQIELAKLNNRLTMEFEIAKMKIGPYSEKQFRIYTEVWANLCELKYSMLELWDQASEQKYNAFSHKLEKTIKQLEKSALVIEEQHYDELMTILNEFAKYEMGKRTLIDYRMQNPVAPYDQEHTRMLIEDNRATKQRLLQYLPMMMKCLRSQLNGRIGVHQEIQPH